MLEWVTFVTVVCLLICSSLAMPSKQVVSKAEIHQTPVKLDKPVPKSTSLHKMTILQVPTNRRRVRLVNKYGYLLRIPATGKLRGTFNTSDKDALIEMESMGTSIVRFKGVASQSYLCMDGEGICHVMTQPTDECLFKEKLGANHFHTFASHKYSGKNPGNITHEFYLAIKKNGKLKHGVNTAAIQKSVDFMVVPGK